MQPQQFEFNSSECKLSIKQNWLKIDDAHLSVIADQQDLARVIEALYHLDHHYVEHEIQTWKNNQINIDGHLYQSKFNVIN